MRTILLCALAALAVASARDARGQANYPEQPVRIIVGFPPGVAPDVTARLLADKFTEAWGKAVLVENVTGAGSNIATDRVAKAPPDGYTLLMGGNSALVISPSLYDKLPYDPLKDFAPITQVFVAANLLVVPPTVPAKTLPELVALARAQPGKLTMGMRASAPPSTSAASSSNTWPVSTFSRSPIVAPPPCCRTCWPAG
jgi:tripartite-type tricarboxylate transporter receptor subunit TctC